MKLSHSTTSYQREARLLALLLAALRLELHVKRPARAQVTDLQLFLEEK